MITDPIRKREVRGRRHVDLVAALLALCTALSSAGVQAATRPPLVALTLVGEPAIVFSATRDRCDGDDVPDAPARAFRNAAGTVVLFAMHTQNRPLRGPDFDHLKIDCRPALPSSGKADPAIYDDASWIAATWTEDGTHVQALVHHEFQANTHPGLCRSAEYLACWWNSVVAVASRDGGTTFVRPDPPIVVAATPFRQDVGQGRHRGFFNPSNIVRDGPHAYFMAATTGWEGQRGGACLFRSDRVGDAASWRAYDGRAFTIRYGDPYRGSAQPRPCTVIAPFPAPVGAIARQRGSGAWIAVFQASADGRDFPVAGLYGTSSSDLITWDAPRLLVAGTTLYDDPCKSGGRLIAYPSLIDRDATGRNFDDVGETADLYFSSLRVEGCRVTSDRDLVRQRLLIRTVR